MPVIRLHVVIANDLPNAITRAQMTAALPALNGYFSAGGISFAFDPSLDFEVAPNAMLDREWRLIDPRSRNNRENDPPAAGDTEFTAAKLAYGRKHLGKLVLLFNRGTAIWWNSSAGRWEVTDRGGHYSSGRSQYVVMQHGVLDVHYVAHEIGHYLHLGHTMGAAAKTATEAASIIRDAVTNGAVGRANALMVFDGDRPWIPDTPPDTGPQIFTSPCAGPGTISIEVDFGTPGAPDVETYVLAPDRTNVMSYFVHCPMASGFSPKQYVRMHASLRFGNRQHLVTQQESWAPVRPCTVWRNDRLHVVVVSGDAAAYHAEWRVDSNAAGAPWGALGVEISGGGAEVYVDGVAAAALPNGQIHIAARRASDGALVHKWSPPGGGWRPGPFEWTLVGGVALSDPVLVNGQYPRLHYLVRGTDGTLYSNEWTGVAWSGWQGLGAPPGLAVTGTPAAAAWIAGPQPLASGYDIVVRAEDGSVWHLPVSWVGGPGTWTPLGGLIRGSPCIRILSNQERIVIGRGLDNAAWINRRSSSVWSGWRWVGGDFAGEHLSLSAAADSFSIAARTIAGNVCAKMWGPNSWTPSEIGWHLLGGPILPTPVVLNGPGERVDFFARGTEGEMLHKMWTPSGGWSPSIDSWSVDTHIVDF